MSCDPNLCQLNKLAKLRRHKSQVHFASNSFGPIHIVLEHFRLYTLGFKHVGRYASHLVHLHVGLSATLSNSRSATMSATLSATMANSMSAIFCCCQSPCRPPSRSPCLPPCRPPCPAPCWSPCQTPCRPPQYRLDDL